MILILLCCENEPVFRNGMISNQAPNAEAGPNQEITLPTNNVSLDGSSSSDTDGTINTWLWKKISGPAGFEIVSPNTAKTDVKKLVEGLYKFALNVTDNGGLSTKDTIQISVIDPIKSNRPPVAQAGSDKIIILPLNSTNLDGSASSDPDNNLTNYLWTKISGPSTFTIVNSNAVQAQLTDLIEGVYVFELKVTDALGLFAVDIIKVTVISYNANGSCDNSDRPQVAVQLKLLGELSKPRLDVAITSANNKIVFAGGVVPWGGDESWGTSQVDIYDILTERWSTAQLSKARKGIASTSAGNTLFFAGGAFGDGAWDLLFTTVDVFDVATGNWSTSNISQPRAYMAATAVGSKVFFAGGEKDTDYQTSNLVDIYDLLSNTWSTSTLSEARAYMSAISINNKVYFAGGQKEDRWYASPSDMIDIYDNISGAWSTSSLSQAMGIPGGTASDDNIYWTSGCTVEIKNVSTWNSTMSNLFKSGELLFDITNAAIKDDLIIFLRNTYNGTDQFDIYNTTTHTWSTGSLPHLISNASVFTVDNTIYIEGQTSISSNKLWKLEF